MFMKTTITLVFSMFLVCFLAHADFVIRQDIDWTDGTEYVFEDTTWGSGSPITTGIPGANQVSVINSRAIFDQNCLYFTSSVLFEMTSLMSIPGNGSTFMSTLRVPFRSASLLDSGDKDMGYVKDLVTNGLSKGFFYPGSSSLGYTINNGIMNRCQTAKNYEFSGIVSLGTGLSGSRKFTIPFRIYGTVQPNNQCSIYLPSTLDIGNYNVETINGKHAEVIANVSCTKNAIAKIKITGQRKLSNDKSCMLTNRTNDLLFCITMDSLPVDLSGNTGVNIEVGPSGKSVVIGAEARTMGNDVAGEHRGELVVTITPI